MNRDRPADLTVFVTEHGIFRVPHHDYEKHGYPVWREPTAVERQLFEELEEMRLDIQSLKRAILFDDQAAGPATSAKPPRS